MQLTASDIVSLYRPTPCSLRLYLRARGVPESEPSDFEQIIQTLGRIHEQEHLSTLGAYENISVVERDQRLFRTLEAIGNRDATGHVGSNLVALQHVFGRRRAYGNSCLADSGHRLSRMAAIVRRHPEGRRPRLSACREFLVMLCS